MKSYINFVIIYFDYFRMRIIIQIYD